MLSSGDLSQIISSVGFVKPSEVMDVCDCLQRFHRKSVSTIPCKPNPVLCVQGYFIRALSHKDQ